MKPLAAMPVGTLFERAGRLYCVLRRTGSNVVICDQETNAILTLSADALGTVKRECEFAFFADVPATRAS